MFDLAIDSKLRGCDVVKVKIGDLISGGRVRTRAIVIQQKTGRPVQFELLEPARGSILAWLERRGGTLDDFVFPSRIDHADHISTRQYARLVDEWVTGIGLRREDYGTHSLRRTKASIIYKQTGNLRAVQIQKLSRGALYLILQNRLYRGEIFHKGNTYPGEHPAIIDKLLCDEVQAVLAANRVDRATGARASHPSLLTGMVFDETGERLTPTHAVKKGTRYRYYVSTSLITGAGRTRSSGRRIPAGNLEGLVINRIRTFLADPGAILDAVNNESHNGSGCSQLIERSRQITEELGAHAPDKVKATLMALFCRVEINPIASTSRSLEAA